MIRATVDTNITVSGLLFGGIPYKIIQAALNRRFVWTLSAELMEEAERVLTAPKFGLTRKEIQILTGPIFDVAEIVVPVQRFNAISRCPGDNRVLECAVAGRCKAIVTGDRRDLLSLGAFHGVQIVSCRQFLEML